jgi:excisionase family DNA binding protein
MGRVIEIPDPDEHPTMRVALAAAILGVSIRAGYMAVERGEWPSVRVGDAVRVKTREFLAKYGFPSGG